MFIANTTPNRTALTCLPDNVELYPHHASVTQQTREVMSQLVVDILAAFFAGQNC